MHLAEKWQVLNIDLMSMSHKKHCNPLHIPTPYFPTISSHEWKLQASQNPFLHKVMFIIVEFLCHNLKITICESNVTFFSVHFNILLIHCGKMFRKITVFIRKKQRSRLIVEYLLQVVETAVCGGEKVCLIDIFLVLARTQTGETWRDLKSDISAILI